MNLGWGWEREKRAARGKRRKQQKLESTPKADFCRSSHWRVQNSLVWGAHYCGLCVENAHSQEYNNHINKNPLLALVFGKGLLKKYIWLLMR